MVYIAESITNLRLIEGDDRFSEEGLGYFGYPNDIEFYSYYGEEIDRIVAFIYEPEEGEYELPNFNVLKTFKDGEYDSEIRDILYTQSYHVVDVGNDMYYLGVWFKLEPWEFDSVFSEFGVLDYQYSDRKVMLLKKGDYTDYLLTINDISELI